MEFRLQLKTMTRENGIPAVPTKHTANGERTDCDAGGAQLTVHIITTAVERTNLKAQGPMPNRTEPRRDPNEDEQNM